MEYITAGVLSLLAGVLSALSPCSLLILPAIAMNKVISRARLPFFTLGLIAGTAFFVLMISFLDAFTPHELVPVVGIVFLVLGSVQIFRAYRTESCGTCSFSSTKKMSLVSLGFMATGFYGCIFSPVAAALAYSSSESSGTLFISIISIAFVLGRFFCLGFLILTPINFYANKFTSINKISERTISISSGVAVLFIGVYLALIHSVLIHSHF